MTDIVCVLDAKSELGEGTLWDPVAGVLWWVDIWGRAIHRFEPISGKDDVFATPERIGCLGLREKGGLIVAMENGFSFFDPDSGRFDWIVNPESERPDTRFNDGKPDRQGRFWSGTVFEDPPRPVEYVGALYRLDADLSVRRMVGGPGRQSSP